MVFVCFFSSSYVYLVPSSYANKKEFSSLPWQHTRRFLDAPPASSRDTSLLCSLLHFVVAFMDNVPNCGKCSLVIKRKGNSIIVIYTIGQAKYWSKITLTKLRWQNFLTNVLPWIKNLASENLNIMQHKFQQLLFPHNGLSLTVIVQVPTARQYHYKNRPYCWLTNFFVYKFMSLLVGNVIPSFASGANLVTFLIPS